MHNNQKGVALFQILSDGALIFLAYFLALWVRFVWWDGVMTDFNLWTPQAILAAGIYSVAMVVVFYLCQLYESFRFTHIEKEVMRVAGLNGVGALILMSFLYIFRMEQISRLAVLLFWLFSTLLVGAKRGILKAVLHRYRTKGYNQRHVVVVGCGHLARQYVKDIRENPHYGVTVDGYVGRTVRPEMGKSLGEYEALDKILEQNQVDELVVALEPEEIQFMAPTLAAADKEGVRLSIVPFYNDYIPPHPTIEAVGNSRLINMRATPLDRAGNALLKRTMDIVGSLVLIILTSPIMVAVAIGVKLSSPGPILFCQERVGRNKKTFKMLKFRSMRITGTEDTGWSTDRDPRKTRFGSFIRKCSLDELPQFFNVLKGEMSLIGPRPEVPFHVSHFKEEIPLYLVRQQVRPGITGWAQVNGLRGDTSIAERVKYDIWYIENWSLGLELKILWKTVFGGMINSEKVNSGEEKQNPA